MPINESDIIWNEDPKARDYHLGVATDFFLKQGWTPSQAAGIVANFDHEPGGIHNYSALGDNQQSFGIGQWNGPRRQALFDYAKGKGERLPSFITQLEFAQQELVKSESKAGELLRMAKTPQESTQIFASNYERPGKPMMESRLKRAEEIIGKFFGPSEAFAAETPTTVDGPNPKDVVWNDSPNPKNVVWNDEADKPFIDQLLEHPGVKSYTDRAKDVARLPGQVAGLINTTLAGPMGVLRRYNEIRDFMKVVPKAKPTEKTFEDKWVQTPESAKDDKWFKSFDEFGVGAKGMRDPGRAFAEQFMTSGDEALKSARESILRPNEWGATSGELWHLALGKNLEDALPEKLKWAAPAIVALTDVLSDPAIGISVVGQKLWQQTAKSVLGDQLFKDLSRVGQVPDMEVLKFPKQLLDDFKKLEALDEADKQSILRSNAWLSEFRANPARVPELDRGGSALPKEKAAYPKPVTMRELERMTPEEQLAVFQRARETGQPVQRGTGMQPSAVADVRPQTLEVPTPAQRIMQTVQESVEQARARRAARVESEVAAQPPPFTSPIQRGGMAPSVVGDVAPVERTMPQTIQRIKDMIEENTRMRLGLDATPEAQRATPIADELRARGIGNMPPEVQQKLRQVLPEEIAAKILPPETPPVKPVKTAPTVVDTLQGPKLQKVIDIEETVKPQRIELDEWKRTRESGFGVEKSAEAKGVSSYDKAKQQADPFIKRYTTAFDSIGKDRLEKAMIIQKGQTPGQLLGEYANRPKSFAWTGNKKTGKTSIQELSIKNLWGASSDMEELRKSMLDVLKTRNKVGWWDERWIDEVHKQGVTNAQEAGASVKKAGAKEGLEGGEGGRLRVRDAAPDRVEAKAGAKEVGKQPWQMTEAEYLNRKKANAIKQGVTDAEIIESGQIEMWKDSYRSRIQSAPRSADIPLHVYDQLDKEMQRFLVKHNQKLSDAVDARAAGPIVPDNVMSRPAMDRNKWQRTWDEQRKAEFAGMQRRVNPNEYKVAKQKHKEAIQNALYEGNPVPPEVLKDYPDLIKKQGVTNAQEAGASVKKAGAKEGIEGRESGRLRVRDVARGGVEAEAGAKEVGKQPWEMTRDEFAGRPATGYVQAKKSIKDGGKYELYYTGTRNKVEITGGELYDTPKQARLDYQLRMHKDAVKQALSEGKPVPSSVLKDYPDLKPAKAKPVPVQGKPSVGKGGKKSAIDIIKSEEGAVKIDLGPTDRAVREALKDDPDYQKLQGMYGEPAKKKTLPTFDHFMQEYIDRFYPIWTPSPETYVKMRQYSSVKDVAQLDFNKLRDGLKYVRNNFETFRDLLTARRAETRAMMWRESPTKPNVAGAQKVKITGPVQPGQKQHKWIWQVKNPNDLTLLESQSNYQKIMKEFVAAGGNEKKMVEALDFWDNWATEHILDVAHRSGFISDEGYAAIRANNDHYATFSIIEHFPDMDKLPKLPNSEYFSAPNKNVIQTTVGTTSKMLDPVEATLQKFLDVRAKAARNDIANTFIETLLKNPDPEISEWARPIADNMEHFKKLTDAGMNPIAPDAKLGVDYGKISRFTNGKLENWAVKAEWADILKGSLNEITIPKIINISNDVFKKGVTTLWLPFGITQVMIDSMAALINSPVYKWYDAVHKFLPDLIRGYASGFRHEAHQLLSGTKSNVLQELGAKIGPSPKIENLVRSGGGLGFISELRNARVAKDQLFNRRMVDAASAKEASGILVRNIADIPKQLLIELPTAAIGALEHGPRSAVFERALKQGKSASEAALLSRDATIDFYRAGNRTRLANMIIPFLNARIQGKVNIAYNSLFKGEAKRDTWAKILANMVVPAFSMYAWNKRYYNGHYQNIDSYIKDNYFVWIYDEHKDEKSGKMVPDYIKIPKGDVGQAVWTPWERVLDNWTGDNPRPAGEVCAQWIADTLLPIQTMNEGEFSPGRTIGQLTPPLAKAIYEPIANKNLYTDRDVDPKWMLLEKVPPHLRGQPNTPQKYKDISKYLYDKTGIDWSPNKLQNVAGNLLGGYGRTGFDPESVATAFKERLVSSKATGNINRAAKLYYNIESDYQSIRYTAIDMVRNGKGNEVKSMIKTWNSNLKNRFSEMEKFGYKDKGRGMRDYTFTPERIEGIFKKGKEVEKPRDWLEERLETRTRSRSRSRSR